MTDEPTNDPPQNVAAEQAVLGLAMSDPRHLAEARAHLNGGKEFWRPTHEALWLLACRETDAGRPADAITLNGLAQKDATLRAAIRSQPTFMIDLVRAGGDALPNAGHYARIVHDAYRLRHWARTAQRIEQLTRTAEPDEIDLLALDLLEQAVQTVERHGQDTTWDPVDAAAVLAGQLLHPPPDLLYRNDTHALLYAAKVHVFAGESESGKTWICLHAALEAMQGGRKVTYLDFEDDAGSVFGRLLALGATPTMLDGPLWRYVRPDETLDGPAGIRLDEAVRGSALVVVDGVTEAMTLNALDPLSNSDAATFLNILPRRVQRAGAAVAVIDHVTKNADTRGRYAIGAQHKLAGVGVQYLVQKREDFRPEGHGICKLTIGKDRYGHVRQNARGVVAGEFHLDATKPNATRSWVDLGEAFPTTSSGDPRPTILMEKVSKYVEAHPGCVTREIDAAGLGHKKVYVSQAIAALISEGRIEVTNGPHGARLHHVIAPFRQADEEWSA